MCYIWTVNMYTGSKKKWAKKEIEPNCTLLHRLLLRQLLFLVPECLFSARAVSPLSELLSYSVPNVLHSTDIEFRQALKPSGGKEHLQTCQKHFNTVNICNQIPNSIAMWTTHQAIACTIAKCMRVSVHDFGAYCNNDH